jgi:tyrosinase
MAIAPHRSPQRAHPRLRHRKSIAKLRPDQLDALRRGFAAIKGLRDNRGFWHWAGLHGAPGYDCEHSRGTQFDSLFLPWHRAYLHRLELALQTQVPQATLPWWDWPASHSRGIPAAYADEQVNGEPNPLAGGELPPLHNAPPDWPAQSSRRPGAPKKLPTQQQVDSIVAMPDFDDFSLQLEIQLHNAVHGWVGGTMGDIGTAAYDPIFWAHHTMVDRLWAIWQVRHSSPGPRPGSRRRVLRALSMTVEDVLQTSALGYVYAGSTAQVEVGH